MGVRWPLALGGLAALGIGLACGNEPPPPATPEAPVTSATPPTAAAASAPVDAAPPPAPSRLPSGDYQITTEVKKDTCATADGGAPEPMTLFVPMRVWREESGHEKVTGNFPLPLPRGKGFGSARSDIVLSPPAGEQPAVLKGMGSQCPEYETKTLYRVLEQTSDSVTVEYSRDYGDASKCPHKAPPPSNCSLDYVYTFKLVNKVCDPDCGVTFAKGADGGLGPKCQCGDGGTP